MSKITKMASIFLLSTVLVLTGCSESQNKGVNETTKNEKQKTVKKISAEEAKKKIDGDEELIILDVRELDEYNSGHVKDSILLPVGTIESEAGKKLTDKNAVILIYCRSGRRSAEAAQILSKLGYSNIYDFGGLIDWPYDIVK